MFKQGQLQVTGTSEIKLNHEFYSYEAKYLDPKGAEFLYPADISAAATDEIRQMAARAFQALGCRDYARADFFVSNDGQVYFNEINTHPGFTNISQFPKLWEIEGMSQTELVNHLVNLALNRSQ